MKDYQCGGCNKWISGYNAFRNHTCGKQLSLNDTIDGVEKLNNFDGGSFDTAKTRQTQLKTYGGEK